MAEQANPIGAGGSTGTAEERKDDFRPYRIFNPVSPSFQPIAYQDLAKPQGVSEDAAQEVAGTITSFPTLGVGTVSPTSSLEVASQTAPQFTIRYDATNAVTFGCDANGDLTITPSGSDVFISSLNLTVGALTPGRVTFAGTAGLLTDDADLTFATDTLTAKNVTVPTNLTLSNLTASRLTKTDGSKIAASVTDLTPFIAGTSNQITVTDDGDGTVTLSTPQNTNVAASPTFAKLNLSDTSNQIVLQSGGVTGTLTWTPATSGKTITLPNETGTVELTSHKDAASGYAGLSSVSRTTKGVDTTDDVIVDLATKGLVLKDTAGTPHYWRLSVSTLGVLTTTDLGTSKP